MSQAAANKERNRLIEVAKRNLWLLDKAEHQRLLRDSAKSNAASALDDFRTCDEMYFHEPFTDRHLEKAYSRHRELLVAKLRRLEILITEESSQ
jgi:hypothetical protein